jgi:shikimate dehydrogenase
MSYKTKVCCLIGDPIEHTLSPLIHNKAFKSLGLDFIYIAFRVKKEMLKKAIDGIKAYDIYGINVTIPHKVRVLKYLDIADDLVWDIGAVNTIKNDEGRLTGYNTDGKGALGALVKADVSLSGKNIVVLGAGGAARAIVYFTVREKPNSIMILNRTQEKADKLAESVSTKTGMWVKAKKLENQSLKDEMRDADLVINCTSVGMAPNIGETPVPKSYLRKDMIVMDIIYNPIETKLLKEAKEAGAITISGIDMFVYQAASAFEIWTGNKAPIDLMKSIAVKALTGELE